MKLEQIAGIVILLLLLYQGMLARQVTVQKEFSFGFFPDVFHVELISMDKLRCNLLSDCEQQEGVKFSQSVNIFPLVLVAGIVIMLKIKR